MQRSASAFSSGTTCCLRFGCRLSYSPGGNIVTDLLFFQARGGEVASIVDEDRAIVAGDYYRDWPIAHPGNRRGFRGGPKGRRRLGGDTKSRAA